MGETVSIARQDHFCAALTNRLELTTSLCTGITDKTTATAVATNVPLDGYLRGAEAPALSTSATPFFRGATESLCAYAAGLTIDKTNSRYTSTKKDAAITDFVANIMGITSADPMSATRHPVAQRPLRRGDGGRATASDALKSTFVTACLVAHLGRHRIVGERHDDIHDTRDDSLCRPGSPAPAPSACAPWRRACRSRSSLNPRSARADVAGGCSAQYLILCMSASGDALNCNVPGTYDLPSTFAAGTVNHSDPTDLSMAPTSLTLAGKKFTAAKPWAGLPQASSIARSSSITAPAPRITASWGSVLQLFGALRRGQWLPTYFAKNLRACLNCVQAQPVTIGGETAVVRWPYLPKLTPTGLKAVLSAPKDLQGHAADLRDDTLNKLNAP